MAPLLPECQGATISAVMAANETSMCQDAIIIAEIEHFIRTDHPDCCRDWQNATKRTATCYYWIEHGCFIENDNCFINCNRWLTIGAPSLAIAVCAVLGILIVREQRRRKRNTERHPTKSRGNGDAISVTPQCSDSVVAELATSFPEQFPNQRTYSGPVDLDDIMEDEYDDEEAAHASNVSSMADDDDDDEESRFTNTTPVISNRFSSRNRQPKVAPMLVKEITVDTSSDVNEKPPAFIRPPKQPALSKKAPPVVEQEDTNETLRAAKLPSVNSKSKTMPSRPLISKDDEATLERALLRIPDSKPSRAASSYAADEDPRSFCSEPSNRPTAITNTTRSSRSVEAQDFEPELNIEL